MPNPFALRTSDPAFDPARPVTVNGFLYVPADDHAERRSGRVPPLEMKRRRAIGRVRRSVEMADG